MSITAESILPPVRLDVEPRLPILVAFIFILGIIYQNKSHLPLIKHVKQRINAWKYLRNGPAMIQDGYSKSRGQPFLVPGPDTNHIFITSQKHIKEMQNSPKDELSMFAAVKTMFQPRYTMLGHDWLDERGADGMGYVRAVGTLLPIHLRRIMPQIPNSVKESFDKHYAKYETIDGGKNIPVHVVMKDVVCRLNAFCFFGQELGSNELFMRTVNEYDDFVFPAAEMLRVLPQFLKKIVGLIITKHNGIQDTIISMVNDVVDRRLEGTAKREEDIVQWIIDTAPKNPPWSSRRITYEIVAIWFGSVHATAATIIYALFDVCLHKEYLEPLREEMNGPEGEKFARTGEGMPLLDSFIKESTRLSPMEAMTGRRQAMKDFTFSDGTRVNKGDWTCVPAKAMSQDDQFFPDAASFNGFRFVNPVKVPGNIPTVAQPEGPSRLVDASPHYYNWGAGGIVCPGRQYAAVAIKQVMVHVLQNFDCNLVDGKAERSDVWRSHILPNKHALVKFTPRVS